MFLVKNNTLLVLIVPDLSDGRIEDLILILKRFKRDIGWTIVDIIGIPLGICLHKIQLIPDSKPIIEN